MKQFIALAAVILVLAATPVRSQDIPPPNPGLVINIVSGYSVEFVFDEIDEYINGIMGPANPPTSALVRSMTGNCSSKPTRSCFTAHSIRCTRWN